MSTINIVVPSLLEDIEKNFGIKKSDILRAIALKSVGHRHLNNFNFGTVKANKDVLPENFKSVLPNSRIKFYFSLSFATAPKVLIRTIRGNDKDESQALNTITLKTNGKYEFDILASDDEQYNLRFDQDVTLKHLKIVEFAMGF